MCAWIICVVVMVLLRLSCLVVFVVCCCCFYPSSLSVRVITCWARYGGIFVHTSQTNKAPQHHSAKPCWTRTVSCAETENEQLRIQGMVDVQTTAPHPIQSRRITLFPQGAHYFRPENLKPQSLGKQYSHGDLTTTSPTMISKKNDMFKQYLARGVKLTCFCWSSMFVLKV